MSWFRELIGGIVEPVTTYLDNRAQRKHERDQRALEIELAVHQKQLEMAQKATEMDNSWELAHIKNSGWKDEWVLVLLSTPLVLAFLPDYQPYVKEGFAMLKELPEWYMWLVMAVFTAIYGIRVWRRD